MDLSNLSSDLPPTKPVNQASINELNRELTTEFKNAAKSVVSLYNSSTSGTANNSKHKVEFANAAKSVAALYRLTNNGNGLHRHMGYLECLDDLLGVITNGEDIENWALTKRAEITNINHGQGDSNTNVNASNQEQKDGKESKETPQGGDEELHIPLDYAFSFSLDLAAGYHFRPSFPPLSVTHSYKQRANFKQLKSSDHIARMRMHQKQKQSQSQSQQLQYQSLEDVCSTSDEGDSDSTDRDHDEIDAVISKKKKSLEKDSDIKRRRLNGQNEASVKSPTK